MFQIITANAYNFPSNQVEIPLSHTAIWIGSTPAWYYYIGDFGFKAILKIALVLKINNEFSTNLSFCSKYLHNLSIEVDA